MDAKIMTLARECVARGWCEPDTSHLEMDSILAEAIARQVAPALAAATEQIKATEAKTKELEKLDAYLHKYREIMGRKRGTPCGCDFDDDDTELTLCAYHADIKKERDAATERAEANATEVHILGERVRLECERRDEARRERDAAIKERDAAIEERDRLQNTLTGWHDRALYAEARADTLAKLCSEANVTLRHARVFITSRQKMHQVGIELYDTLTSRLEKKE